jgi:PTH2 family peptidyl-tRNA hydrolase
MLDEENNISVVVVMNWVTHDQRVLFAMEKIMSENVKMVIAVRRDLSMRKGKIAAQVAHAAMKFLIDANESEKPEELKVSLSEVETEWLMGSFTKVVVGVDSEDELNQLILTAQLADIEVHPIVDNGLAEFNGVHTLTCAAFGPDKAEELDRITGNLKLI